MNLSSQNEIERVRALRALDILDTLPEEAFDRFARLAAGLFQVPVARVSLIDADREFLKASFNCEPGSFARDTSFCTWTVAQDEPLIVPNLSRDPRFRRNSRVAGPPNYRFYAGAPLINRDGLNLGAVCCLDMRPRKATAGQIALLQDLAQMVVEAMELRLVATTDSLTGAMTRRAFMDSARRDIRLTLRAGRPLACLMFDVDHFKAVNDSYGHAAGDDVLRRLSAICREILRDSDYVGRLGGEEFAVVLRDTRIEDALGIAERLRAAIEHHVFSGAFGELRVTASFGLSALRKGQSPEELVAAADDALYSAKRLGRNRTSLSVSDMLMPPRRPRPRLAVA